MEKNIPSADIEMPRDLSKKGDHRGEKLQKKTQKELESWWRKQENGSQEISKAERDALFRGDDIEVENGRFVHLDQEVDNEFDLEWKTPEGEIHRLFIRDQGQGVFHIFDARFPERYVTIFTAEKRIEDAQGNELDGTLAENLTEILGVKDHVKIKIVASSNSGKSPIYRVQVIPQKDIVSVRRARNKQIKEKTNQIQLQNDFYRGNEILIEPEAQFPLTFDPQESVFFRMGNQGGMNLEKKKLKSGKEIYVFVDSKNPHNYIYTGLQYDEKRKRNRPFYIYFWKDAYEQMFRKQFVPNKLQMYLNHPLIRFSGISSGLKLDFESDEEGELSVFNKGNVSFSLQKKKEKDGL